MATEKMTMVTLTGPVDMVDFAIQRFAVNRNFHPVNAVEALSGANILSPFEGTNPYVEPLSRACAVLDGLDIRPAYRDFSQMDFHLDAVRAYLDRVGGQMDSWRSEREALLQAASDSENLRSQFEHYALVNEKLGDLYNMRYVKLRFGRIPINKYADCLSEMKRRDDAFFVRTGEDGKWVFCMYCALPSAADHVDALVASMGYERIRLRSGPDVSGTVKEAMEQAAGLVEQDRARAGELGLQIAELAKTEREALLLHYCWLRFMSGCYELRALCGQRHGHFYLVGWVPAGEIAEYEAECDSVPKLYCIMSEAGENAHTKPPVKLKGGFLQKVFSPFMEMYGLPAYGEIDPRLFMAVTYIFLFGIMFGDLGQGAVLVLLGFLLWKKTKMPLWRIISCVGVSSMVFGCVYGSVFGYEDLLPWEGFYVLGGDNMTKILLYAVGLGMAIILFCMAMNIVNGIRAKDTEKIFFSPNGVVGGVFYLAVTVGVVRWYAFGAGIGEAFSTPYVVLFIVLPLVALFLKDPLSKLAKREKRWMPKSLGMFFFEGFFEMFETLLSYLSNTISFLRVGAFAISHAGMMMVVFMLAKTEAGGSNIFVVILGNILVLGLEAALSCIQLIRLEFYEMFGRFYTGGGERFAPRTVNYAVLPTKN